MRPVVIGITGKAGSGKDTACEMLYTMKDRGRFVNHLCFANSIKNMAWVVTRWNQNMDREQKEAVDPHWGVSPREFWQELGTWGRKMDPDFWVKALKAEVDQNTNGTIVITDVRYDNEAKWIVEELGGIIWQVEREDIPEVREHSSENGIDPSWVSITIENNGTLEELQEKVSTAWLESCESLGRDSEGRIKT